MLVFQKKNKKTGNICRTFSNVRKSSASSGDPWQSSAIFRRIWVIVGGVQKCSGDIR